MNELETYEPMIWATIRKRLHIPTNLWDEAYSEGLVVLAKAYTTHAPERHASLSTWIQGQLFWRLHDWRDRELTKHGGTIPLEEIPEPFQESNNSEAEWQEAVSAGEALPVRWRVALFAEAVGYSRKEIGQVLNTGDVSVGQMIKSARHEIRQQLGMI